MVDGCLQKGAAAEDLGEEPELERGPLQLALEPLGAEMSLQNRQRHQVIGRAIEPGR